MEITGSERYHTRDRKQIRFTGALAKTWTGPLDYWTLDYFLDYFFILYSLISVQYENYFTFSCSCST
jgi:hypothetical protein